MTDKNDFDSVLNEKRRFSPPANFIHNSWLSSFEDYQAMYRESLSDPHSFWSKIANELYWFKKWERERCPVF
jgi:acetyl-CoA synthetase